MAVVVVPTRPPSGLGWGLLGVVAFSFTVPFTRVAAHDGLSPLFIGSGRAVVAATLAAIALAVTRQSRPSGGQWPRLAVVAGGVVVGFPLEVDEGPISVVAVDARTGRDVGAVRPITSDAGDLVSDPSGMRYVGLRFPKEADDEMLGQLVAIRNSKALPLGKVDAFAVTWG